MKKFLFILLILTVFIGISAVSAADNVLLSDDVLEIDNVDEISGVEQNDVISDSQVNDNLLKENESGSEPAKKVSQVPKKAKTKNIKSTYGTKAKYSLKLLDKSGKIIAGKTVKFKVGKKVYRIKTGSDGIATLKLNYPSGKYTIKYSVGGTDR